MKEKEKNIIKNIKKDEFYKEIIIGMENRDIRNPNERLNLTRELLEKSFNNPVFINYIKQMILHLNLNGAESGFVARESRGEVIFSELEKSPRIKSDPKESYQVYMSHLKRTVADENDSYSLPNIFLQLHSHPLDRAHGVNSWELAGMPSEHDMNNFEKDSLRWKGIIEGIVSPDKGNAKILLMQMNPNLNHNLYYQAFEYGQSIHTFRKLLTESDIRSEILTLPSKADSFSPEELSKLSTFI